MVTDYDGSDLESEEGGTFRRGRTHSSQMGQFSVAFEPGTAGLPAADENTAGKVHYMYLYYYIQWNLSVS